MKQQFYIYSRRGMFYMQDSRTGKQQSLETRDRGEALRLLEIKRQSVADSSFNQIIVKTCLTTQDSLLSKRTWQTVMEQMQTHGKDASKTRCSRAMRSKAFDRLRSVKLVETNAEDFLTILNGAKISVAHYLKRLHNLALGYSTQRTLASRPLRSWNWKVQFLLASARRSSKPCRKSRPEVSTARTTSAGAEIFRDRFPHGPPTPRNRRGWFFAGGCSSYCKSPWNLFFQHPTHFRCENR